MMCSMTSIMASCMMSYKTDVIIFFIYDNIYALVQNYDIIHVIIVSLFLNHHNVSKNYDIIYGIIGFCIICDIKQSTFHTSVQ